MQIEDLLKVVEDALDELKAKDVVRIDVRELTSVTDFMIIASGSSSRQVSALSDTVVEKAKESGCRPLGVEGKDSGEWVLVDLGDIIVHIMQPATRQFYDLERLWQSAESRRAQQQKPIEE
ncbi:MAG: ribosome silencing factor [Gammaproteobacteria bacterium HGW-Gammaproteobacteria-11]|nr:MAG: ribosome silencing factor [Gammaproteobacteria bacterium HGW-Gammaproteobacteria-11]